MYFQYSINEYYLMKVEFVLAFAVHIPHFSQH